MKIKIIDLLNKIANKEEVPKKIKYDNTIYERHRSSNNGMYFYHTVSGMSRLLLEQITATSDLLEEVEIIEEDKKIKKIEPVRGSDLTDLTSKDVVLKNNALIKLCKTLNNMNNKINELIDEVNKLKEGDSDGNNNK